MNIHEDDRDWQHQISNCNRWILASPRPRRHSSQSSRLSINDLSWSRFGSLQLRKSRLSKENGVSIIPKPKHKDIAQWLKDLELEEYLSIFDKYEGVEDILEFSETDLKELGVKKSSHRATIISSLTLLRAKYHDNFQRKSSTRHSMAVVSSKVHQEDTLTDLRVVSEAVQSKSLNNLIMEQAVDPNASADLRKALEWELSLDGRDLRSHAWYHGGIPRARAEEIVKEDGCFLIRDCTSQPGNYVLTCRTKGHPLHFVINKVFRQPDTVYERVEYQFEDEAFDTIQDLITFYVGSGKPITVASEARIQTPVNRMYPLSFYASKYPTPLPSRLSSPATTPVGLQQRLSPLQPYRPSSSPIRKDINPRVPSRKQRSQSLTPSEQSRAIHEKCNSADGVIQSPLMTRSVGSDGASSDMKFSTHSLPRTMYNTRLTLSSSSSTLGRHCRITSDPTLSPCVERRCASEAQDSGVEFPPPKPSRVPMMRADSVDSAGTLPSHGSLQRITSYHASGSDSGNGSGDSALSGVAGDNTEPTRGVIIKNPRYHMAHSDSTTTLKNFDVDYVELERKILSIPEGQCINFDSRYDLDNYQTLLLPVNENKPLDAQALRRIKMTLAESGSRILANHLTRTDLDVVFGKCTPDHFQSKLCGGIELGTLPHGSQFRQDLIERTECLRLLVAVSILTCADEGERTETLNKWIEVAIDTKTALGNLYGFCGIMLGLCLPQIEKLDSTWHMLRQKYTDSAFNFEAKLRPILKSMNSCSNPQAPNTTIPHLLPLMLLLEREPEDFHDSSKQSQLAHSCLSLWETNSQDFGLSTLLNHLQAARKYMEMQQMYLRNAEIVLAEARMDELTLDIFKTEFHLKFLWGSRGAIAPATDRHAKFEQVLTVMAEKYCSVKTDSEV